MVHRDTRTVQEPCYGIATKPAGARRDIWRDLAHRRCFLCCLMEAWSRMSLTTSSGATSNSSMLARGVPQGVAGRPPLAGDVNRPA